MTDSAESPPSPRSGFVALAGRPNVGKSTLMNAYLGQKVAIVSDKPQTTRRRQLGILTRPGAQVIFVDVPGIHRPRHALGEYMLGVAERALKEADAILFLADVSQPPTAEDEQIAALLRDEAPDVPVVLGLNKSDLLKPEDVLPHTDAFRALAPSAEWMLVSATRGDNRDKLLDLLIAALPEGPPLYPEEEITDAQVRDLAAELVREAALNRLRQEVPHGLAVEIEDYDETDPAIVRITAIIYVERESHKGIVIGKGGEMLKAIGTAARSEIESLIEAQVFLKLTVRVRPAWRKSERGVQRMGYT
jgi:GTP-binding protein Era